MNSVSKSAIMCWLVFSSLSLAHAGENSLAELLPHIKPAIVAIGTNQPSRTPVEVFMGTGFVVGDGRSVVTNAHVVAKELDTQHLEHFAIYFRQGDKVMMGIAELSTVDHEHDLALLKIKGQLPALEIGDSSKVKEGEVYGFTGYPLGMVLGVFPVTHKGMISAISPSAIPASNTKQLNVKMVKSLKSTFEVFQLDATAYPGNSGSPLYDMNTGKVYGILDKVFVQGSKENAITNPSGISYAIPSIYIKKLLERDNEPE